MNPKLRGLPGILAHPRQNRVLTVSPLRILQELLRLLDCKKIQRSSNQPKLLAHTSLCTLLQRPQLCEGKEILEFCGFHANANLTVFRNELVDNLKQHYGDSYVGVWVMFDESPKNKTPFVPNFGDGHLRIYVPPKRVTRYHFKQVTYSDHLAEAITAGNNVAILTRAADSITEGNSLLQAIQNAPPTASLAVILLDWELALGHESTLIQRNWALLQDWNSRAKASFKLLLHAVSSLDVEVALIGDDDLLVSSLAATPLTFSELQLGDPLFAYFKCQVQKALNSVVPRVKTNS